MNSEYLHLEVADRAKRLEILQFFRSKGFTLPWTSNKQRDYYCDYTYLIKQNNNNVFILDINYWINEESWIEVDITAGYFSYSRTYKNIDFADACVINNFENIYHDIEYIYDELLELNERIWF